MPRVPVACHGTRHYFTLSILDVGQGDYVIGRRNTYAKYEMYETDDEDDATCKMSRKSRE